MKRTGPIALALGTCRALDGRPVSSLPAQFGRKNPFVVMISYSHGHTFSLVRCPDDVIWDDRQASRIAVRLWRPARLGSPGRTPRRRRKATELQPSPTLVTLPARAGQQLPAASRDREVCWLSNRLLPTVQQHSNCKHEDKYLTINQLLLYQCLE